MRGLILSVAVLLSASCAPVFAGASACYAIVDADSRRACLAGERGDKSLCYAVQDAEKRAKCMAEVG